MFSVSNGAEIFFNRYRHCIYTKAMEVERKMASENKEDNSGRKGGKRMGVEHTVVILKVYYTPP